MLSPKTRLTFFKADLVQYNYLVSDPDIREKVSSFLLQYIAAEAFYKKLLVAEKEKNGKKLSSGDKRDLKVKIDEVRRVLRYFGVTYDDALIERIFGSNDTNYMDCSMKKLRDRLVHKVNDNVVRAIIERAAAMESDILTFFSLFA